MGGRGGWGVRALAGVLRSSAWLCTRVERECSLPLPLQQRRQALERELPRDAPSSERRAGAQTGGGRGERGAGAPAGLLCTRTSSSSVVSHRRCLVSDNGALHRAAGREGRGAVG